MIQNRPGFRLDSAGMARMLRSSDIGDAMADTGQRIEGSAQTAYPKQIFDTNRRLLPTLSRRGGTSLRAGAEVSTLPDHWGRVRPSIDALTQAAKQARKKL